MNTAAPGPAFMDTKANELVVPCRVSSPEFHVSLQYVSKTCLKMLVLGTLKSQEGNLENLFYRVFISPAKTGLLMRLFCKPRGTVIVILQSEILSKACKRLSS